MKQLKYNKIVDEEYTDDDVTIHRITHNNTVRYTIRRYGQTIELTRENMETLKNILATILNFAEIQPI